MDIYRKFALPERTTEPLPKHAANYFFALDTMALIAIRDEWTRQFEKNKFRPGDVAFARHENAGSGAFPVIFRGYSDDWKKARVSLRWAEDVDFETPLENLFRVDEINFKQGATVYVPYKGLIKEAVVEKSGKTLSTDFHRVSGRIEPPQTMYVDVAWPDDMSPPDGLRRETYPVEYILSGEIEVHGKSERRDFKQERMEMGGEQMSFCSVKLHPEGDEIHIGF